jgi:hypothetical protein
MSKAEELAKRWLRMADYAYQCRDDLRDSGGNTPRSHELRLLGDEMTAELRRLQARVDALEAAARPATPLTEEQIWKNDAIMECNAHIGAPMAELVRLVRAVESAHGITTPTEASHE